MLIATAGSIPVHIFEWSFVLRNTHKRTASAMKRAMNIFVGTVATAAAVAIPSSPTAYQDIAELFGRQSGERWLMNIQQPAGQTVFSASLGTTPASLVDPVTTSSLQTAYKINDGIADKRQPQRINRKAKGPRVVSTTPKQAPKHFSAGSVLQRQSVLQPLNPDKKFELAFVKPKPHFEALKVASLFHPTKKNPVLSTKNLPVMVASLVKESESSVLAYAPEPKLKPSPFAAVLREEAPINLTPKLNKGDHAWAAEPLPKHSFSKKQQTCLANGIYFEARGEPVRGQAAVSQVILNRVRNPHYPNSICGVVYQNKHWRNRCQFSFACDRVRDTVRNKRLYDIAKHVAKETTNGRIWLPQVGSSTHYHATYVNPRWARTMKRVGRIGLHIFYRTYGGGWS